MAGVITINEVGSAIFGAFRLALRDPGGMAFFDRTPDGARKSFFAAALILPVHAVETIAARWEFLVETGPSPGWFALEFFTYVISWTLIPVLMIAFTRWIDRWDRYCDFLVSYNWGHIIFVAAFLPLHVLSFAELLPLSVLNLLGLAVLIAVLFYLWFILKVALDISGGMAASLVAGEYIIGRILFNISDALIYGG